MEGADGACYARRKNAWNDRGFIPLNYRKNEMVRRQGQKQAGGLSVVHSTRRSGLN